MTTVMIASRGSCPRTRRALRRFGCVALTCCHTLSEFADLLTAGVRPSVVIPAISVTSGEAVLLSHWSETHRFVLCPTMTARTTARTTGALARTWQAAGCANNIRTLPRQLLWPAQAQRTERNTGVWFGRDGPGRLGRQRAAIIEHFFGGAQWRTSH